jgi:hypothetical protein
VHKSVQLDRLLSDTVAALSKETLMPGPSKVHSLPGLFREFSDKIDAAADKLAREMAATGDHAVAGMEKMGGAVQAVKQTADDMTALADFTGANGAPPLDGSSGSEQSSPGSSKAS